MLVKKIVSAFIAVCIIVGMFSGLIIGSAAASVVKLAVSNASGKAGEDVTVSINISPNSRISLAGLLLKYDTNKLKYKKYVLGAETNTDSSKAAVNAKDYFVEGNIKGVYFVYVNAQGLDAGGSLVNITFTIEPGWSGSTPLDLTTNFLYDADHEKESNVPNEVVNGSVTVKANPGSSATTVVAGTGKNETTDIKQNTDNVATKQPADNVATNQPIDDVDSVDSQQTIDASQTYVFTLPDNENASGSSTTASVEEKSAQASQKRTTVKRRITAFFIVIGVLATASVGVWAIIKKREN